MIKNELIQTLNNHMDICLAEGIPMEELQAKLTAFINDLIQNDFEKLVSILYRIDVDENKLKIILKENPGTDAAFLITGLLLERESQKLKTRKQFKS